MRSIAARLARLEQRPTSGRCPNCQDWRGSRVVTDPPTGPMAEFTAYVGRFTPQPPERCPVCGWRPKVIVIRYTHNWRGHTDPEEPGTDDAGEAA